MYVPSKQPIRKGLHRREVIGDIRFITFSCYRRVPLLGHAAIRDLLAQRIARARQEHGFELFAWVIMPEHAHLLLRPRDGKIAGILRSIKTSVAKRVVMRWREMEAPVLRQIETPGGRGGGGKVRFWQAGGGFDRNVRSMEKFCKEVRYIHRNPVERELVERPEDWRWSSVRWWMGQREGEIECDPPPGDPRSWEKWRWFV